MLRQLSATHRFYARPRHVAGYAADFIGGRLTEEQISTRAAENEQQRVEALAARRARLAARQASNHSGAARSGTGASGGENASEAGEEGELPWDADFEEYGLEDALPSRLPPTYSGPAWALPGEYSHTLDNVDLRGADLQESSLAPHDTPAHGASWLLLGRECCDGAWAESARTRPDEHHQPAAL